MKTLITIFALVCSISAFAGSDTDCWTDSNGNIHCTTTTYPQGDITPHGAY